MVRSEITFTLDSQKFRSPTSHNNTLKKWTEENLGLNLEDVGLQPPVRPQNRVQRVSIDLWWRFRPFPDLSSPEILARNYRPSIFEKRFENLTGMATTMENSLHYGLRLPYWGVITPKLCFIVKMNAFGDMGYLIWFKTIIWTKLS